jgi:hypothetical protein
MGCLVRAELQMLILTENIDSGPDVQPRIPRVNVMPDMQIISARFDRVPLAFIGNSAVKKRG